MNEITFSCVNHAVGPQKTIILKKISGVHSISVLIIMISDMKKMLFATILAQEEASSGQKARGPECLSFFNSTTK